MNRFFLTILNPLLNPELKYMIAVNLVYYIFVVKIFLWTQLIHENILSHICCSKISAVYQTTKLPADYTSIALQYIYVHYYQQCTATYSS